MLLATGHDMSFLTASPMVMIGLLPTSSNSGVEGKFLAFCKCTCLLLTHLFLGVQRSILASLNFRCAYVASNALVSNSVISSNSTHSASINDFLFFSFLKQIYKWFSVCVYLSFFVPNSKLNFFKSLFISIEIIKRGQISNFIQIEFSQHRSFDKVSYSLTYISRGHTNDASIN